jgi:hypothetical protein
LSGFFSKKTNNGNNLCYGVSLGGISSNKLAPLEKGAKLETSPGAHISYEQDAFGLSRAGRAQLSALFETNKALMKNQFKVGLPTLMLSAVILKYVATRHCDWHHNRYTIGISFPVLSY